MLADHRFLNLMRKQTKLGAEEMARKQKKWFKRAVEKFSIERNGERQRAIRSRLKLEEEYRESEDWKVMEGILGR